MKKQTEPMMDYCEFFATEEEAIAACREVNRGLNSKDPACCVVVDGPEDNYAVVDLETAKDCSTSAKMLRSRAWLLPISYPVPIFSHGYSRCRTVFARSVYGMVTIHDTSRSNPDRH